MLDRLARNWWMLAIRGVAALAFGVLAFVWPASAIGALVLLFGFYAFVDAGLAIATALHRAAAHERWGGMLLEGVLGILAGIAAFIVPGITTVALVYVVGFWAILTGLAEIAASMHLRREAHGEWTLSVIGVLSVVFGGILIAAPLLGAVAVVWWIAAYALVFGALLLSLAIRLRAYGTRAPHTRAAA